MAYTPSLDPALYTDADSNLDQRWMRQMYEQDRTPESTDTNKPRFTLIVGPSPFSMPRGWEFFLTSPYEGASYISTVLLNAGHAVRIVDVRYSFNSLETALRQVREGTDVLGICTYEDNFPWCRELMARIRSEHPDMPIICGGSLVTSVPEIFMSHTECDVGVISEGEITILELMDLYCRGGWDHAMARTDELSKVRGVVFRKPDGEVVRTPARGQMPNLESLPIMRLDLWPQANSPMGMQPQIISSYSRGCKMDCSFCYRTTPQERSKSPEQVDRELAWYKDKFGIDFVFFVDLTFTSHKKQTLEILDAIRPHDIRWTCLTRCADVDEERLVAMKSSGCDIALYGVESLGGDVLKEARKGNTENITIRAMRRTFEADIRFGGLLIVGLPGETEESLDHMSQWSEEFNHITRVKYLSAMPGTTIYTQGIEQGIMKSEVDHLNWLSIEQALHEDEFLNYNGLHEQVMRDAYKRVYDSYQPGPVMDFKHWPECFEYFSPNANSGQPRSTEYAGENWRAPFSSAARPLVKGSERFTLEKVGASGAAESGALLMPCGAKELDEVAAS